MIRPRTPHPRHRANAAAPCLGSGQRACLPCRRRAPEVMQAIERMVREAQPFPAPWQLGGVVYTE
ncbi:MAG: hypothetical protein ACO3IP_09570, partial [Burkholderiaceae bacterium]